jgi:hypothetical protein
LISAIVRLLFSVRLIIAAAAKKQSMSGSSECETGCSTLFFLPTAGTLASTIGLGSPAMLGAGKGKFS